MRQKEIIPNTTNIQQIQQTQKHHQQASFFRKKSNKPHKPQTKNKTYTYNKQQHSNNIKSHKTPNRNNPKKQQQQQTQQTRATTTKTTTKKHKPEQHQEAHT